MEKLTISIGLLDKDSKTQLIDNEQAMQKVNDCFLSNTTKSGSPKASFFVDIFLSDAINSENIKRSSSNHKLCS